MNSLRVPITLAITLFTTPACLLDDELPGPDDGSEASATSPSSATSGPAAAGLDTCAWAPTVAITPTVIPPTPSGVPVVFDLAVTNPNPASCPPLPFVLAINDDGLLVDPRPGGPGPGGPGPGGPPPIRTVASGATSHITVTATAPASADGGDTLHWQAAILEPPAGPPPPPPPPSPTPPPPPPLPPLPPTPPRQVTSQPVAFPVAIAPGCQVSAARELMITDVSVVDDPVRTTFDPASRDPRNGVWTFKHLVEQMARTPRDAPALVEAMLSSFSAPQIINGFTVAARPGMQSQVLASWPRTPSGALDLARAPLRLLAIVSRLDLRDLDRGDAGEGRFVFAFDLPPVPDAPPPEATIIFEYKLPAAREADVVGWAESFHALGSLPLGASYNAALQAITERFVRRGARPTHPNGSAINAVRTNEIPFGDNDLWELRELRLSRRSGQLEPATLEQTPDLGFNQSSTLAAYIHANQAQILAGTHTVPRDFGGQPFQAGAMLNDLGTWLAPGVDSETRHQFAVSTCNGCHAAQETGTLFLHLRPRPPGQRSQRSRWLTGLVFDDPVTGAPRLFDDLGRRKADLKSIVCSAPAARSPAHVRKGVSRVH